ncbi:hypothetical protein [Streptomyces sp. NPDC046887]|uniref:hypothetical protein n=1 Tax=Streptomyces sp. NPDC046887 TaxID=3155472 RepID=UPI0033C05C6F
MGFGRALSVDDLAVAAENRGVSRRISVNNEPLPKILHIRTDQVMPITHSIWLEITHASR